MTIKCQALLNLRWENITTGEEQVVQSGDKITGVMKREDDTQMIDSLLVQEFKESSEIHHQVNSSLVSPSSWHDGTRYGLEALYQDYPLSPQVRGSLGTLNLNQSI